MIINEKAADLIVNMVEHILALDETYSVPLDLCDLLDSIAIEYPHLYTECQYIISKEQTARKISVDNINLL